MGQGLLLSLIHIYCLKFYNEDYGIVNMNTCFPYSGTYIMKTTNSGFSWDSVYLYFDPYNRGVDFEFVKNDPSKIWFITCDTLYFSPDGGKTWLRDPLSPNFSWGRDLVIVDDKVCWFLCETVYRNLNANTIVSVNNDKIIPSEFMLFQNYPNPFNPVTTIKYIIPQAENVNISVYDIIGNRITTLVNEETAPGEYNVQFNATDLASGVYFYSIKAGTFCKTMKFILLK